MLDGLSLDDDGQEDSHQIALLSKDKKSFLVSKKAAMMSNLIKTTLDGDPDAVEVNLFHIDSRVVEKVIEYMNYHVKHPPREIIKPLPSPKLEDAGIEPWDIKFVDTTQDVLFTLLLAANYLDIKPLLFLVCAKIGSFMKGKTPAQILQVFNIRSDYTPEEEEEVRKKHKHLIG